MVKQVLHSFFDSLEKGGLSVEYWDNDVRNYGDENPKHKIIFHRPPSASIDFSDPMIALGEAYMEDIIDFEGDFDEVMKTAKNNKEAVKGKKKKLLKATSKLLNENHVKEKQREIFISIMIC